MAKLINQDMKLKAYAKKIVVKQNGKLVEVPSEVYKNGEWISIQNEFEDEIKLGETTITPTNEQQIILAKNSGLNGFKKVVVEKSNPSFNIAYGDTPPADTSKLWLNCNEPSGVEINGNPLVSTLSSYDNTTDTSVSLPLRIEAEYTSCCDLGNNEIAILGTGRPIKFNYVTKAYSYLSTSSISGLVKSCIKVGNKIYFSNYVSNAGYLYSLDLETGALTSLVTIGSYRRGLFMYQVSDNVIGILTEYDWATNYLYYYYIDTKVYKQIFSDTNVKMLWSTVHSFVKVGKWIYSFGKYVKSSVMGGFYKFNVKTFEIVQLTSVSNVITSNYVMYTSAINYGNKIYILGGQIGSSATTPNTKIYEYDIINDTFTTLDIVGIGNNFISFADNNIFYNIYQATNGNLNVGKGVIDIALDNNKLVFNTNNDMTLKLINADNLVLLNGIEDVYIGNTDNLAEKVDVYYYNDNNWILIN